MKQQEAAIMLREWYIAFDRYGKGNERTVKEFLEIADMLEDLEQRIPSWISVKERLPEEIKSVLVAASYEDHGLQQVAFLIKDGWYVHGAGKIAHAVTHWMPLPEPPEEDDHATD